jgi:hypothetical protein
MHHSTAHVCACGEPKQEAAQDLHIVGNGTDASRNAVTFKTMPDDNDSTKDVEEFMKSWCFRRLGEVCNVPDFLSSGKMEVMELARRGAKFSGINVVDRDTTVSAMLMTTVDGTSIETLVQRATRGCAASLEQLCTLIKTPMGAVDFDHCWSPTMFSRPQDSVLSDNDEHVPDYDNCPPTSAMAPSALFVWRFIHTLLFDNVLHKPTLFGMNTAVKSDAHTILGLGKDEDLFELSPYYAYKAHTRKVASGPEIRKHVEKMCATLQNQNNVDAAEVRTCDAWAVLLSKVADVACVCDRPDCLLYIGDGKTANFLGPNCKNTLQMNF